MTFAAPELLRELASWPRFAGSASESAARARCAGILRESGFVVDEVSFDFSEFPARAAPPMIALLLGGTAISMGAFAATGHYQLALILAITVATSMSVLGRMLSRNGVLDFPWMRSSSTNLVAERQATRPGIWLVAHIDSKSQTIPMLLRVGSAAAAAVLFTLTVIVILAQAFASILPANAPLVLGLLTATALLPILLCFAGNRSHGALDNASGVVSILAAAEILTHRNVGVIITSGEELGLAGARAFVRSRAGTGVAINCDTIDDSGKFLCMRSGSSSEMLESAIERAAARTGVLAMRGRAGRRLSRMLPGVLADNVAFTDAGWQSFTLSRGNLRTLSRVHTQRDCADSMHGTGIVQAAALIAAIVEELS